MALTRLRAEWAPSIPRELMAGAVLVALPTVLLYLVLGRFFVSGLTAGAVK